MEKFPELRAAQQRLKEERAAILAEVEPLQKQRDALVASMEPLEVKARELAEKIKKHRPRLAELENQIGALARAMGARAMSKPPEK